MFAVCIYPVCYYYSKKYKCVLNILFLYSLLFIYSVQISQPFVFFPEPCVLLDNIAEFRGVVVQ